MGRFELDVDDMVAVAATALLMLIWAILVIRIIGLRSLSKMSSFDFVVTVALGSAVASTSLSTTSLWNGVVAFAVLLGAQWVIAQLRFRTTVGRVVDNRPILLVHEGSVIEANLRHVRVTHSDITAKLREAGVTNIDDVLAVVMETTGDVSVLTGSGPLDARLLAGVRGAPSSARVDRSLRFD
jgi:uncharacterized membrane protein YcaP (DUF421 family)